MAKLMGMHNRITEKRYNAAKAELKTPKDDKRVMKKYGFGETTARRIRNTDNYYEYYSKSTTGKRRREHLQSVLADVQKEEQDFNEHDDTPIDRIICFGVAMLAFMALAIGGIIYLIVRGS